MILYQITDENLNPLGLVKSPRGIVTHKGIRIDNAWTMTRDELADLYVFEVPDTGRPNTDWQIITSTTVNIVGDANAPRDVVCTLEFQVQDISLVSAREKLISAVKAHAGNVKDGGYSWEKSPGETYIVDSDLESRVNLVGLNTMATDGDLEDGLEFSMADDQEPQITKLELLNLTKSVGVFVVTIHGIKKARIKEIKDLTDLDAFKAYDPMAGFPPIPEILSEEGA